MDEDEKSAAIVKTILLLGENLDIEVVAEGIETVRQLEVLRTLGCSLGQGYIFSEPLNADEAGKLLVQQFVAPAVLRFDQDLSSDIVQLQQIH
jgi:EAL domain-containing protein (putative c-di-GMP-specific phosphodiesterase class I)